MNPNPTSMYRMHSKQNTNRAYRTQTMLHTILLTIFSSSLIHTTSAQSSPGCISNIILCGNYVATTAVPPKSCCDPLKIAITTQIDCLCGLYNTPGLLQSFNINVTQALDVPKRCGMVAESDAVFAACTKVATGPSASKPAAPTGTSSKDENSGGRMIGHEMSSGLIIMMTWLGVFLMC